MSGVPPLPWMHTIDLHLDEANSGQNRDRLARFDDAFPEANRPVAEVFASHGCIFLDIVSTSASGPDFRLTMHHRNRRLRELTPADADIAFFDTAHTHYDALLNDGGVLYGATRPTGEIVAKPFVSTAHPVILSVDGSVA